MSKPSPSGPMLPRAIALTCVICVGLSSPAMAQDEGGEVVENTHHFATKRHMIFVPNLSLNIGFSTQLRPDAGPRNNTHPSIAAGMAGNLVMSDRLMGFVSGQLEVEHHELSDGREVTYFMPMVQTGFSMTGCYDETPDVLAAMFPCLKVYGMAGVRPAPAGRPAAMRLGVGFSSAWIPLAALSAGTLLPSSYEGIVEMDPLGNRLYMFRIGLGF